MLTKNKKKQQKKRKEEKQKALEKKREQRLRNRSCGREDDLPMTGSSLKRTPPPKAPVDPLPGC